MASNLLCPWLVDGVPGDCATAGADVVNNKAMSINAGKTTRMQARPVPCKTLVELWRVDMYGSFAQKDRRQRAGLIRSSDVVVTNCS